MAEGIRKWFQKVAASFRRSEGGRGFYKVVELQKVSEGFRRLQRVSEGCRGFRRLERVSEGGGKD